MKKESKKKETVILDKFIEWKYKVKTETLRSHFNIILRGGKISQYSSEVTK